MMNWDTYVTLLDMEQKERAEKGLPPLFKENQEELLKQSEQKKDKGDKKMNNINFSTMTDTELQNLIEQAGKEQDNRIREKREIAEQTFWRVANELNALDTDYELFDTGESIITIGDIIVEHEEKDRY